MLISPNNDFKPQALVSFKKYIPPPLPYFKVNICPLSVKCLSSLHDKYVIVPADKASNNIVFVCKSYYFEYLIKELGINSNTSSNTTYKPTSFDKDEILANHRSFMTSLNIPSGKESEDLPYLYWIPKLHKT